MLKQKSSWQKFTYIALLMILMVGPISCSTIPSLSKGVTNPVVGSTAAEQVLQHLEVLTSFYEIVITILILLIGLVAGFAYMSIKHISKTAAEEIALEASKNVIRDSHEFRTAIDAHLTGIVEEKIETIGNTLQAVEEKLETLARRVSDLDSSEIATGDVIQNGDDDGSS